MSACPCGRTTAKGQPLAFDACCGPYHSGQAAPDAESLMRSRYSAFCLERAPYLLRTWHASHRPASIAFDPGVKWLGLEVRHAAESGDAGVVEFVARCRDANGAQRMHETSRFVREAGRWYYIDGQVDIG